jgi:hypothetical protein
MGNVNSSELPPLTKSLSLISWHIFTIFLLISAFSLVFVAYYPDFFIVLYPIFLVNLLGAVLFILLGLGGHKILLKMPGAYLMGGTALLIWFSSL